jgi:hypothetical protein
MKLTMACPVIVLIIVALAACAMGGHASPATDRPQVGDGFRWIIEGDGMLTLVDGDRRVLRYMHAYDTSTPQRLHETYKCYDHVFDAAGEHLLTKGPGGLYTHHRVIFIGFNRLTVDGDEYDFWHMKGVTQRHMETLELSAGATRARQGVLINWCDDDGGTIIAERRQVTVHREGNEAIAVVDFESRLTALRGDVLLNGDPEHAGIQFRAHNDVADGPPEVKASYLFHKEGIDPREDVDLPWVTMTYGLNDKQYSVQHMNHPDNPHGTVYSAYRDYGRFGAFPKTQIKAGETLTLRYRLWIAGGGLPARDVCARRYGSYIGKSAANEKGTERAEP